MYGKSKGILAFANNSPSVNYEKIANQTLMLAGRSLNLPVHLVIGQKQEHWKNSRQDTDTKQFVVWNNFNRYDVWNNTPFDQTLVIDVDYLITTDRLNCLFDSAEDLVLCDKNHMLNEDKETEPLAPIWATVFYFRKTSRTKIYFGLVGRIQRNWHYYRTLFGIRSPQFRNDYAFSMAAEILKVRARMPFGITTVNYPVESIGINQDWMVVRTPQSATVLPRQDLHVMSKSWLQSDDLERFCSCAV